MVSAECRVTCNEKDFREAKAKVYSLDEFEELLK